MEKAAGSIAPQKGGTAEMSLTKIINHQLYMNFGYVGPKGLRKYLLVTYSLDPFPYYYTEEDLLRNINEDISAYRAGNLDITIAPLEERLERELDDIKEMYLALLCEIEGLQVYVRELENILEADGLESSKMKKRCLERESDPVPF